MIDRIIGLLKWPVALLFVLLIPGSAMAFGDALVDVGRDIVPMIPFLVGLFGYWLMWILILRRPAWGSMFSTLEHEFTHAVFAMLTGHRVYGLKTSWKSGGEVTYRGRGNWLIVLSPYFFPTLSVLVALGLSLVPGDYPTWASIILGVTISYHVTSTWRETHREQPDLLRVGFPFAIAFLPGANLLIYGLLIAFATGGRDQLVLHLERFYDHTVRFVQLVLPVT